MLNPNPFANWHVDLWKRTLSFFALAIKTILRKLGSRFLQDLQLNKGTIFLNFKF